MSIVLLHKRLRKINRFGKVLDRHRNRAVTASGRLRVVVVLASTGVREIIEFRLYHPLNN